MINALISESLISTDQDAAAKSLAELDAKIKEATVQKVAADVLTPEINRAQQDKYELCLFTQSDGKLSNKTSSLFRRFESLIDDEEKIKEGNQVSDREREQAMENLTDTWTQFIAIIRRCEIDGEMFAPSLRGFAPHDLPFVAFSKQNVMLRIVTLCSNQHHKNIMKNRIEISMIGIALLLESTSVIFLSTHSTSHAAELENKNSVSHVAGMYRAVAPFDANKNNTLEEAESNALTKAITDDSLKLPDAPQGPWGMKPPAGILSGKLAKAYETLAPFDKNKDATLAEAELKQLQAEVDAGRISLPIPPTKK